VRFHRIAPDNDESAGALQCVLDCRATQRNLTADHADKIGINAKSQRRRGAKGKNCSVFSRQYSGNPLAKRPYRGITAYVISSTVATVAILRTAWRIALRRERRVRREGLFFRRRLPASLSPQGGEGLRVRGDIVKVRHSMDPFPISASSALSAVNFPANYFPGSAPSRLCASALNSPPPHGSVTSTTRNPRSVSFSAGWKKNRRADRQSVTS
jgi:hypothetical protein